MRETGTGKEGKKEGKTEPGDVNMLCLFPTLLWYSVTPIL